MKCSVYSRMYFLPSPFHQQRKKFLFVACGCLLLFLLGDRLRQNVARTFREDDDLKLSVRVHFSNVWVWKNDKYFSDKEHDDLLASSLRRQHFEPSSEEPAVSWPEVEGEDDYFERPRASIDFESSIGNKRSTTCQTPVRSIVFLKTHYTGGDIITNIINRFADIRDIPVALPADGLSSFYWPKRFHWRYMDMKRLQGELPRVLCNHARYNPDVMEKFMLFNTRYVTVLRNPIDHLKTVFKELNIATKMNINNPDSFKTFIQNPKFYIKKAIRQKRFFDFMNLLKNGMFFDLGLHTSQYHSEIAITSAIFDLQTKFSIVLIYEYLDESLVLMKRKFCWDMDDIIYLSSAFPRTRSSDVIVSSRIKEQIVEWNMADVMLYDFFNATLWERIQNEKDFYREVAAFKARRVEVEKLCRFNNDQMTSKMLALADLNVTESLSTKFKLNDLCEKMRKSETHYLEYLRNKY